MTNDCWYSCDQPPPEGLEVLTKSANSMGEWNRRTLKRKGTVWFAPGDPELRVYYTPTHWRLLNAEGR